jgi:LytS/YehU family sensor histidine kinase
MQARVEPQFLFSTLTQVEHLYERDPQSASRMLDELIVYLRAALPHLRDTSSTVEKEIALTRAYVNIARIRLGGAPGCDIAVAADARDARFPPLVLLPLIDHVVASAPPRHLAIAVTVVASRVLVLVRGECRIDGLGNVMETLRDRLRALYGEDARIELVRAGADGVEIAIEVPHERA